MAIALSGLIALAVAMGIGRFAFTPILPMMQKEGQLTLAAGGWLASANYVGYFVGALAAMFVRLSPALAIRASLAAIAVTTFAMAFGERMEGPFALGDARHIITPARSAAHSVARRGRASRRYRTPRHGSV